MIFTRLRRTTTWPALYLLATGLVFVVLWRTVLTGHDGLVGGDILRNIPPWSTGGPPQPPRNALVADPVTQFLPWLTTVRAQWLSGHIPTWNPSALAGAPLLANDQSAVFSPFTLLALPFAPAQGYSLAMLLKLIVAGVGMGAFLRQLRVGYAAALVAGVAYACSSFMVDWLGHPQSAVASLFPWAFACVELWLRSRRKAALAGLAIAVALQFLAGHAETTLHLGVMLAFYAIVRGLVAGRARWEATIGIVVAAALGTLLAGVQLVPFLAELRNSTLVSDRAASGAGFAHLQVREALSWIIPNAFGNPGIDGAGGPLPNYLESTGFIGVAALLLGLVGLARSWLRQRSVAVALGVPVVLAAGVVYGPLAPIAGRLPLLSSSSSPRMLAIICLGLSALAGLGFQAIVEGRSHWSGAPWSPLAARALLGGGAVALVGVVAMGGVLAVQGAGVDRLLPTWHGRIGFWILLAVLSLASALFFIGAASLGRGRTGAAGGLALLVLAEAAIFAGPFQPRVPLSEVPPPSPGMTWLEAHAGSGAVAAPALALIPNLTTIYGVRDVRGYDVTIDPRVRLFWSRADPGYNDGTDYTQFATPGSDWLAAAGVRYYLSTPGAAPAGASTVYDGPGYVISEVSGARPFAFAASSVVTASGRDDAVAKLAAAPLGPIVVETGGASPPAGLATVAVTRQDPGAVDLDVRATTAATVVVLQSYTPDWVATIDGSPTPLRPADVLFQSFSVAAGHHAVTLRYRPVSVSAGLATSALGAIGVAGLFAVPAVARRGRRRTGPSGSAAAT